MLYCILFLHQTTTAGFACELRASLYCILFLHQTTTFRPATNLILLVVLHPLSTSNHNICNVRVIYEKLYCILFLHQTTTATWTPLCLPCCIASSFYIKPQLKVPEKRDKWVVLHPLSTSNHNSSNSFNNFILLYCILFLHQTTTRTTANDCLDVLYCILFLHQTTTSDARHFDFRALNSQ